MLLLALNSQDFVQIFYCWKTASKSGSGTGTGIGTGTGTKTFPKYEPEPQKIITVPQQWLLELHFF
jgi:hypothetical protein